MTTISKTNPITLFAKRLKQLDSVLGKEIKNYLPFWWDDALLDSPGAVQQALISIAKLTGLDIKSVLSPDEPLIFRKGNCCYKHSNNKEKSDLEAATALVHSLSLTLSECVIKEYSAFQEAQTIRKNILSKGKPWIDFKSLVDYCWSHGVPVLYLPELPVSKKMDAVVVETENRPVISLTKKCKHESDLLFFLAHEMGHIFHQHLEQGQTLIDKGVHEIDERDEQEKQANTFALELLIGTQNPVHSNGTWLTAEVLAEQARIKSIEWAVDPGHIALNWAHTMNLWGAGKGALNILYPFPDWEAHLKQQLIENIDEDESNETQLAYLYQLMHIEE
jgi:IrrE N-terminal-like domain